MDEGNFQAHRGPLPPAYLLAAILVPVAWRLAGPIPVAAGVLLNVWADQPFRYHEHRAKVRRWA